MSFTCPNCGHTYAATRYTCPKCKGYKYRCQLDIEQGSNKRG